MTKDEHGRTPQQPAQDACLTPEALAAFLDARVGPGEAASVRAHLAACESCYAVFSESARFLREASPIVQLDPAPADAASRRRRIATIALPLAAAAILVVSLLRPARVVAPTAGQGRTAALTTQPPPELADPRPTPHSLARPRPSPASFAPTVTLASLLTDGTDLAVLAGSPWKDEPAGLGFADGASRERTLVLIGVHILDLDVALRAGELGRARERLSSLRPLADAQGEGEAVRAFAGLLGTRPMGRLSTDALRARLEGTQLSGEGGTPAERRSWIRFGEWVEAGRLAALSRHVRYFGHAAVRSGLREARTLVLPEATLRPLDAIEGLLEPNPISEAEWRRLEHTFGQILLLL